MSKRKYYILRGRFANEFNLCYENDALPEEWERITRREAEGFARGEAWRRKYDQGFSGRAPQYILPYSVAISLGEWAMSGMERGYDYTLSGRVVTFK